MRGSTVVEVEHVSRNLERGCGCPSSGLRPASNREGEEKANPAQRLAQFKFGGAVRPWKVELMDYEHARVRLHFCKVFEWRGVFEMRERQSMAWQTLPVEVTPVLPGTLPVLRWFAEERGFAGATHQT